MIGKYASENGPIAAVRKFRVRFTNLNESTARAMRKKYQEELKTALQEKHAPATTIVSQQRGRPLMLADIDGMVQNYLKVIVYIYTVKNGFLNFLKFS